ncbi:MAG: hypothetical protein GTO53_06830 [Planctomycetales bacterium]|nr:hypothetical protein [Planctomycetales bacterium]NIM08851.1 hypothetical protein [Planctomycetales bacterium]NIN08314.1 hypothetical protein [Planctomycetales bacterium]NIN77443.1 hypothetical protein [Planctomycetales bacterium]NIO34615.1 hypothetical protein [Planctomycetales bacterium]
MAHSSEATVGHGDTPHEHHQHGSIGTYMAVFVALCVLTGASFFTYSPLWPFSDHVAWAFMMAVSCTKAMLVILFFMHLKYEANWKYVLTVPATFMSIFLVLMLVPDVGLRMRRASEERLRYMAVPQVTDTPAGQQAAPHPDGH